MASAEPSDRTSMEPIRDGLRKGEPLSVAMSRRPEDFPEPLRALLGMAERTGQISPTVSELALGVERGLLLLPGMVPRRRALTLQEEVRSLFFLLHLWVRAGATLGPSFQALAPACSRSDTRSACAEFQKPQAVPSDVMLRHPELFPAPVAAVVARRAENDGAPSQTFRPTVALSLFPSRSIDDRRCALGRE
jgi:type II secretory pathway component PulF